MQDAHQFLRALTIVLCVAAVTTVACQRLRQPVVRGLSAGPLAQTIGRLAAFLAREFGYSIALGAFIYCIVE